MQGIKEGLNEDEQMKQPQRMMVKNDMTLEIKAEGTMDANNNWWVSDLLASDCEKPWFHAGLEDTMGGVPNWAEEDAMPMDRCEEKRND